MYHVCILARLNVLIVRFWRNDNSQELSIESSYSKTIAASDPFYFLTLYFLSTCYISISFYYLQVEEFCRMKVAGNKTNIVAIRPGIVNKKLVQRDISTIKHFSKAVGAHKLKLKIESII